LIWAALAVLLAIGAGAAILVCLAIAGVALNVAKTHPGSAAAITANACTGLFIRKSPTIADLSFLGVVIGNVRLDQGAGTLREQFGVADAVQKDLQIDTLVRPDGGDDGGSLDEVGISVDDELSDEGFHCSSNV
jgi:hypothetical protein